MILTPIDTVKTTLQTQGKSGMRILRNRVRPAISSRINALTLVPGKNVRYWLFMVWRIRHRRRYIRWALSCQCCVHLNVPTTQRILVVRHTQFP
jgi:hypothetical protein